MSLLCGRESHRRRLARAVVLTLACILGCAKERPAASPGESARAEPAPTLESPPEPGEPEKLRFPAHAVEDLPDGPGWLGVELAARGAVGPGVLIEGVLPGSPAAVAGLLSGDAILTVDGEPVAHPPDVIRIVSSHRPGERVGLVLDRRGQSRLLAVALGARPDSNELMAAQYVGNPAPPFRSLTTVQGSVPDEMAGLRGRVVVLEFWASWCMVCRLEIPVLNGWQDRYGARGLSVLGVTTDPPDTALQSSLELGISYAVASDANVATSRDYRALSIPTLFVIDRRGVVRDVVVGYSSARLVETEALVRELLATP